MTARDFGTLLEDVPVVARRILQALARRLREIEGAPMVLVPTGATTFHRAGCRLVEGKRPRSLKVATAERRGLTPCTLCDPLLPAATSP